MTDLARRLAHTGRDFATITAEIEAIIREVGPEYWTDFFASNLGKMLINMSGLVGDMVAFGQDAVAQEMYLSVCRRFESALRFANSVGYRPRAASAAEAILTSGDIPTALVAVGGTIPAGTRLTGANGLSYEVLNNVLIPAGAGVAKLTVREGTSYTETFTPSAKPHQKITTTNAVVEEGSWDVYVGSILPSNLWDEVENIDLETGATETYSTEIDVVGRLVLRFGDGTRGRIPDQPVYVKYRKTAGSAGNTPSNTITGSVPVNLTGGGVVTVNFINTDQPDNTQVEYGVPSESQGLTLANATQTGVLVYSPAIAGSVILTFNLPTPGDKIVVKDNGAGGFTLVSASGSVSGVAIIASSVAYTSVQWSITFSISLAAGGTIFADYSALQTADVAGLISGAASGGTDRETVDEMRRNIPAYISAQRRIVTANDYKGSVENLTSVARAYIDTVAASYTGNFVRTSVWQSEVVDFTVSTDDLESTVSYKRYKTGTVALAQTVSEYLRGRTVVTTNNIITLPSMLWVDLYFKDIFYDASLEAADVHLAIVKAVVTVFEEGDGFNVRLSDIINAIRSVDGVRYFSLDRVVVGTRAYSQEAQTPTNASATVTGRLALRFDTGSIISPGSVSIVVDQPSGSLTIQDNGSGGFSTVAGTRQVTSSSIDYNTGYWSVTFDGGALSPNRPVIASYSDVIRDYRSTQLSKIDDVFGADQYPPPGILTVNPPQAPPYFDGKPSVVLRAGVDVTNTVPYQTGDETRYEALRDISSPALSGAVHFFNEQFYYNNEILYDSTTGVTPPVRTINLRKLVFPLLPINT